MLFSTVCSRIQLGNLFLQVVFKEVTDRDFKAGWEFSAMESGGQKQVREYFFSGNTENKSSQVEVLELDKETVNQGESKAFSNVCKCHNSKSFDVGCLSKNKKKIIIVALLAVAIATLVGILAVVFGSSKHGLRRIIVAFCACICTQVIPVHC